MGGDQPGGGMTSKLFRNVREKMSLCYSIDSAYYGTKGILLASAGIDFDKEEQTRAEVAAQLSACCRGEISEVELLSAKEARLSSLRASHDSPAAIEGYYATAALSGLRWTPAEYTENIISVTAADVARVARSLQLHTGYFLKGVQ